MVAVTKTENPVYTNDFDRSVNKVKTVKITNQSKYKIVDLAVSVVLLLEMNSVDEQQTKVLQ